MITIKDKIFQTVLHTISEFKLIKKNDKIVIGISGGADSLSLFLVLNEIKKQYSLKILLAHLNHQLRGDESDKDEKFLLQLSKKYHVPIIVKRVNIPLLKEKNRKLSIEEISHFQRYEFFYSLLKKKKFSKIALGHNLDDRIEGFFLRAFNGGSLKSLSGIKPVENKVIRPLINCFKNDIEEFVRSSNISHRFDSSNENNSYPRNWIRNKLIPYIEKNYKPIKHQISQVINILSYENNFMEDYCQQFYKKLTFKNNFYNAVFKTENIFFKSSAVIRRVLQKIFVMLAIDYNFYQINLMTQFLLKGKDSSIQLDLLFLWKYKEFVIITLKKYIQKYNINIKKIPEKIYIKNLNLHITIKEVHGNKLQVLKKNELYFDKEKLNEIIIRQKKISDYIILINTGFKVKLKKFFIDCKIPVPLKNMIPVIESNNEVIGLYLNIFPVYLKNRVNDKYKVTEKTKKVIKMEFTQEL